MLATWPLTWLVLTIVETGRWSWAHGAAPTDTNSEVQLRLRIDEAGDHVLGDRIPLLWEFTNLSTNALGFLWEGCCRINGRLTATAPGLKAEAVPPGQALAHAFAKAERLAPGVPRTFDTALGDWVQLNSSGTYRLEGTYTGVQPTQKPQVPRGLALWTKASHSEPVMAHVWTVADYLSQRAERERVSGVRLTLSGPDRLDPVRKQAFHLRITNIGKAPLHLPREDLFALWLVRSDGSRCTAPASNLSVNAAEIDLPPGESREFDFELGPETIEGEAFGDFKVFIDVRHLGGEKGRTPSNPVQVGWSLGKPEVESLLVAASSGARTGARNAPLKLLRTYLTQVAPMLRELQSAPGWNPRTEGLRTELAAAAELIPLARIQGRAFISLRLDGSSPPDWKELPVKKALGTESSWPHALDRLLSLRRHVGLELSLRIEPSPATPLEHVLRVRSDLESRMTSLADAPHWVLESPTLPAHNTTQVGPQITVLAPTESMGANPMLQISRSPLGLEATWHTSLAVKADAAVNTRPSAIPIAILHSPKELAKPLAATPGITSPILIRVAPDARWSELLPWLAELQRQGHSAALQITASGTSEVPHH